MLWLRAALLVLGVCLPSGCGTDPSGAPRLLGIEPAEVPQSQPTPARVTGENFYGSFAVSLDDDGPHEIRDTWQMWLGSTPLTQVRRADSETLEVMIPGGLALGPHDLRAAAPTGETLVLRNAVTVVAAASGLTLRVEDAPGGKGAAVGDRELKAGASLTVYAVLRDGASYVRDAEVTWEVRGDSGVGALDAAGPGTHTTMQAEHAGEVRIAAIHPTVPEAVTGTLRVVAAEAVVVRVEDAPGGSGAVVGDRTLAVGDMIALHAVSRDSFGNFVGDEPVGWMVGGAIGTVAPALGEAATFEATTPGVGRVDIEHGSLPEEGTGELTVRLVVQIGEACGTDATCVSGHCVGGTCCAQECGSPCMACSTDLTGAPNGECTWVMGAPDPSLVESPEVTCDGIDNDCNTVVDEGCSCDYLGLTAGVCLGGGTNDATGVCSIAPFAYEDLEVSCGDGLDNDCDGIADINCCDPGGPDTDNDGVPDLCDRCQGHPDGQDVDADGVPDGCDVCAGFDDTVDTDGDGVPNGCDVCAGFDDAVDTDGDGVPNGCDVCAGYDDTVDTDNDGVPDGCDVCAGFDDTVDTDGDGVPDGCDVCPGAVDPPLSTWWDTSYGNRWSLTVQANAGILPAGYSVVVTVDTQAQVAAGKMLPDASDLRVVWTNGGTKTEIDRHVLRANTNATEVWFKTQAAVPGADGSYALYFGNPTPAAPLARWSDRMGTDTGSRVYLAADSFEAQVPGQMPAGWVGSNRYKVLSVGNNQVLEVLSTATLADYLFAGSQTWGNVVVSARLRVVDTTGQYYGLFVRSGTGSPFFNNYFGTAATTDALEVWDMTIAQPTSTGLTTQSKRAGPVARVLGTTWHTLAVGMVGRNMTYYFDDPGILDPGAPVMNYMVPIGAEQGRMGLCVGYPVGNAWWDDVIVRMFVSPEPTASIGASATYCP